jgi:hypothetical protein
MGDWDQSYQQDYGNQDYGYQDPSWEAWEETADPGTGQTYWYNNVTGDTSWENPYNYDATQAVDSYPGSLVELKPKIGKLPPGWQNTEDPETGKPYWFNPGTNEVSWDRPELPPHSPRVHASDMTEEAAATMVEKAWRAKAARKKIHFMIRAM